MFDFEIVHVFNFNYIFEPLILVLKNCSLEAKKIIKSPLCKNANFANFFFGEFFFLYFFKK